MSLLSSSCCCGKCYFGVRSTDPDASACSHNTTEKLEYRVERPAHSTAISYIGYSDKGTNTCDCAGQYTVRQNCPAQDCIEVDYSHFHCDGNSIYTWNYFVTAGGAISPPRTDNCCGYSNNTCDDVQCDQQGTLCSTTHRRIDGSSNFMTCFQATAISNGTIPAKIINSLIPNCEYGDTFWWLQDIADCAALGIEGYRKYQISLTSGAPTLIGLKPLAETILCVVHKEKWWKRSYNSLSHDPNNPNSPPDGSADDQASACRTPKYWLFACSGVPLFHFEVYDAYHVHGTITEQEMKDIFKAVANGTELPIAAMNKLESAGVVEVKDHGRSDGKIIKKSLNFTSGLGNTSTVDRYFYARPGGWDYVCHNWAATTAESVMCSQSSPLWPHQIPRRYSLPGSTQCSFGPDGTQCHTAAPLPTNNCVCQTIAANGSSCTDICGYTPDLNDCDIDLTASCSSNDGTTCTQDIVTGNCKGVWIQFSQYDLKELSTVTYQCTMTNDGYICRVPNGGSCDFGELPDEISHQIPEVVSSAHRQDDTTTSLCCGGIGLYSPFGNFNCVSNDPVAPDCPDPDDWGEDLCS